ncbi:ATP-dependent DNA helicase RecG [Anaerococcus prevotii]|uniref:Putative ATP-dependent DNA helicase RecG n=1 Tax=Anaerococcus prevotii ACS-065-V-Col13 TaxID=879305 RepID=F0GUL6_9FIRM|nr:ATP-dependent DNA helicase RecG [Anaerococcus prevotii]EGC82392.1 putative ATP-dependent DNA helicase RecG [Anaerococcus prevotii ACS-065-V-Col13]
MKVTTLKGIGPKKSKDLKKLGIVEVSDLYNYYPKSYEDRSKLKKLANVTDNRKCYFEWKIVSRLFTKYINGKSVSYIYAREDTNKIRLIWFNDRFSPRKLVKGKIYKFYTSIRKKSETYEAINPIFCDLEDDEIGSIVSMYSLTKGLSNKQLSGFIAESLKYYDGKEDILDDYLLEEFSLNDRLDNLKEVHSPTSIDSLSNAKSQIKIIDLLKDLYICEFLKQMTKSSQDLKLEYDLNDILSYLSFDLTRSQVSSLKEILKDCESNYTSNRLLVGDVGSGKTIVALIVMLIFAMNGYQSAMMVPTELLAIQQYEKSIDLFNKLGISAEILTSSSKDKNMIKDKLAKGDIDILMGTHALIQEDVIFKNLKFVVNDEQHRFGVSQRQLLALKGERVNYLTMTATPIPRTLSLRISDIIDLSIIDELPKGRKSIDTYLLGSDKEDLLYETIANNIDDGRQVYVVTNNIDSDDRYSLENLYKVYKKRFKSYRVEMLHGKLKPDIKESILKKFQDGEIDILLATTVIEVGIDVSNANTMVIYNSNNFGLSTLHQLRGRVGRGEYKSFCYLITDNPSPSNKLNILVKSNDGFEIAKKDYDLRGGGKILSYLQHGKNLSKIEYLNMNKDEIDKAFYIYKKTKSNDYEGVNLDFIKEFYNEEKRIILN